jgi:hypothetical protein
MQSSQFTEEKKNNQLPDLLDKNDTKNEGQMGRWQSLCVSLVDAVCVSNQMAKHRSAVSTTNRVLNADCTYGGVGSSSLHTRMNAVARLMQPLRCRIAQQRTLKLATVSCSTRQTHSARKHWHVKRSAQHSTRAAAAAPALSSRDPASHAPSPSQPSSTTCAPCAYQQAQWPVAGTRTPRRGA